MTETFAQPQTAAAGFPAISVLPFALLLLAIAVLPLAARRFWHRGRNQALVVGLLAAPIVVLLILQDPDALLHTFAEYVSFIVLLAALFTISGGIVLRGDLLATPSVNVRILAAGAVVANLFGTMGASMLFLRPLLKTNSERQHVAHIPLFFILTVSNAGGMLTPLGDPPLFLGYLRGVPFFWTLRLFPIWLLANVWLLALFFAIDSRAYSKESRRALAEDQARIEPLRLRGYRNMPLLLLVAGSVFLPTPARESVMAGAALLSYVTTPSSYHKHNAFSFAPMREVAILFAGIFVTMVPALATLHERSASLGITEPWQFFWITGGLSSVLDNAPTYLAMFSIAQGLGEQGAVAGVSHGILLAISAGAVLMGANTYIGNGPNFMVKAIAEHRGIRMPSFAVFSLQALAVMAPIYLAVTLLFLR